MFCVVGDDGVNTYKAMCRDSRVVAGAAATEIELARRVKEFSFTETGLDQYAIANLLRALRTPRASFGELWLLHTMCWFLSTCGSRTKLFRRVNLSETVIKIVSTTACLWYYDELSSFVV